MLKYVILREVEDGVGFVPYKMFNSYLDCMKCLETDIKFNILNNLHHVYEIYCWDGKCFVSCNYLSSDKDSLYEINKV